MKTLKLTALALFLLASSSSLIAQTADEIVSKYITTIGGAAKLKALKGVKMEMPKEWKFLLKSYKNQVEKCT